MIAKGREFIGLLFGILFLPGRTSEKLQKQDVLWPGIWAATILLLCLLVRSSIGGYFSYQSGSSVFYAILLSLGDWIVTALALLLFCSVPLLLALCVSKRTFSSNSLWSACLLLDTSILLIFIPVFSLVDLDTRPHTLNISQLLVMLFLYILVIVAMVQIFRKICGFSWITAVGLLIILSLLQPIGVWLVNTPSLPFHRAPLLKNYIVPSTAMSPTITPGDRIVVDHFYYSLFDKKRGDVVVFTSIEDNQTPIIKRIAGLPGETIDIKDHALYIDGKKLDHPILSQIEHIPLEEIFPEWAKFGAKVKLPLKIPADSYFLLGDNSRNSKDSRMYGCVPATAIYGKVIGIWWPARFQT